MVAAFATMGWQTERLGAGRPWSNALMWATVATGFVAAWYVVAWSWSARENARRLLDPDARDARPDRQAVVLTWIAPLACIAVAAGIVAVVGGRTGEQGATGEADAVSAVPFAVAVVALLLAIPLTYRLLKYLTGVMRQVGGDIVHFARWTWVSVVMAVIGIASMVALRLVGVNGAPDGGSGDLAGWVPPWVIAVAAIVASTATVVLAWRAGSSLEDAMSAAASRRRPGASTPGVVAQVEPSPMQRQVTTAARTTAARTTAARTTAARTTRINLVPGVEALRFGIASLMVGLALLSGIGAVVTAMLWLDSRDTGVVAAERQRTRETLEALSAGSMGVAMVLLVAAAAWTFVTVLNVRMTSGRRRHPAIAALAWPGAAGTIWWIAHRVIVDGSVGSLLLGFAAQALALAVPFHLLLRSAAAVGARRTPLRIAYVLGVVLLAHVQGPGGLHRLPDPVTTTEVGRFVGYLAIGALIQLCAALAVTEACRALSRSCRHEAQRHNMLVDQRSSHRPDPAVGR